MTVMSACCVATARDDRSHGSGRAAGRRFVALAALAFVASAAATAAWCGSMSSMDGMAMPGGWTMSMAWMRMPGRTWLGSAAAFAGMWAVMMVAMMLPSFAPMLWRYREAVEGGGRGGRIAIVAAAYFLVWMGLGIAVFPLGVGLAEASMRSEAIARAVPFAGGLVVAVAGLLQLTRWKARQLACCRRAPDGRLADDARTAWRHGIRLGLHCAACCASLTAILLVLGVMDLRAMATVTVAVSAERLLPAGLRIARAIGVVAVGAGLILAVRAIV